MQPKITSVLVVFLLAFLGGALYSAAQDENAVPVNDRILQFYWDRANASVTSRDPIQRGLDYAFTATTYYKKIGKLGKVESTDSLATRYFYSFGNLDSTRVLLEPKDDLPAIDFDFPNVFERPYYLNDFPNDTGGQTLAIGFDSDTEQRSMPTGLAMLDRNLYYPHWLYLYYPEKDGYRRYSRSFRFTTHEGFLFPDSIWEVATRNQFLFRTTYRLETRIDSLTINH